MGSLIIFGVLIAAYMWTALSERNIETPKFTLLSSSDYGLPESVEVRKYEPMLLAQVTVEGDYMSSLNEGFVEVARYIFGGNTKKEKVGMTAPVIEKPASEKIAMTAPVIEQPSGETSRTISFVMPSKYTKETLPTPNSKKVKFVEVPEKTMAVLKFSWWFSERNIEKKKKELARILTEAGIAMLSPMSFAGYDPPWRPPWHRRNEVMVEIKEK